MRRLSSVVGFVALATLHAACTQDFGVFQGSGIGGSGGTGTGTGIGGASSSSSSSSSSSGSSSSSSASSASSASSTSSSSSSSSSSTSASSSGSTGPEVCANGIDDDSNGDTDCADAACTATHACVTTPPAGWNGPVVLYDGDPATVPACPPEHPTKAYEGHGDLVPEPAACAACVCAPPAVTCQTKLLQFTSDAACTMAGTPVAQPAPGNCLGISPTGSPLAVTADAPTAIAGACSPSGGAPTLPPPVWQRAGLACSGGGLGLGCGAGKVCTANADAPFVAGLCVYRTGDVACPSSYPDKHKFTDSVIDTRDCTGCVCGGATGSCSATTKVYEAAMCNGGTLDVPNDGSCVAVTGNLSSIEIEVTKSGSCAPSGGQAIGSIVPGALATTICCSP